MDRGRTTGTLCASILALLLPLLVAGGDIVHKDDDAPTIPGCSNNFVLVKVQTWINNKEDLEFVGVSARFGKPMESKEKHANETRVSLADPPDCCTTPKNKITGDVLLVHRGGCKFTTKAKVAEAAGASAILIKNNRKELYKMVCERNETDLDIGIPVVMLPQDAGASMEESLNRHVSVAVQLYSPDRPLVDTAEVFLWLMAVGTILCASYWSAWSAREASIDHDQLLKHPHVFLLACQIFMEGLVFTRHFSLPMRAFVPVFYNGKRMLTIMEWVRNEVAKEEAEEHGSALRVHVWRGLALANMAFWGFNLFAFLLPVYLPRAFKRYYLKEKKEV